MPIDRAHPLLLASGSPRRRALLERLGIPLEVQPVEVDERIFDGEAYRGYLERVVQDKRTSAAEQRRPRHPALLVADTVVVHEGRVLTKPKSRKEADAMLRLLSGSEHLVATRFCLLGERAVEQTVETRVWFRDLGAGHRRAYLDSGEGEDKAGGYAIQGIGAMWVRRIEGSYTNVVGLPLCEVVEALESLWLVESCPIV